MCLLTVLFSLTLADAAIPQAIDGAVIFNEMASPRTVRLSGRSLRALIGVERYRRETQARMLTEKELDPLNFSVRVWEDPTEFPDLTVEERRTLIVVSFWPLYSPGEPVLLDSTQTANGRAIRYLVRKRDFRVVRAQLIEPYGVYRNLEPARTK